MRLKALAIVTAIAMLASIYATFIYPPVMKDERGEVLPVGFRIFYFHVPQAWGSYLMFTIVFIAGIMFLKTKVYKWDIYASCAAELGVVLCTLTIITGAIWAKIAWGVYWTWEARLTTVLFTWFVYAAYLLIRSAAEDADKRARYSAVFSIAGYITVPLSYISVSLWPGAHPPITVVWTGIEGSAIKVTFFLSLAAYTLLFILLLLIRIEIANLAMELESKKEKEE
jgi:heme exporter protein C